MHITFVKKLKADGLPCRKCVEVQKRLEDADLMHRIDHIALAEEADPESEGMRLSRQYGVERAPFFIVEEERGAVRIYTTYLRFIKEVLDRAVSDEEEATELLEQMPAIDYL